MLGLFRVFFYVTNMLDLQAVTLAEMSRETRRDDT